MRVPDHPSVAEFRRRPSRLGGTLAWSPNERPTDDDSSLSYPQLGKVLAVGGTIACDRGVFAGPRSRKHSRSARIDAALIRPEWTGAVTLRSSDPAHLPLVTPQDLGSKRDMAAMLDGM
jgi:hypothetical protein